MSYKELKEYLTQEVEKSSLNYHGCIYPTSFPCHIIKEINNYTKLLSNKKYSIQQKIHWIIHDIGNFPRCKICGIQLDDPKYFRSIKNGYRDCCSSSCVQKLRSTRSKQIKCICKKTKESTENISNIFQLNSIKQKICDYWTNKYGDGIVNPGQVFNRKLGYDIYLQNIFVQPMFTYEEYNEMCNKIDRYHNKHLKWRCLQCGNIFETNYKSKCMKPDGIHKTHVLCPKCTRYKGSSIEEEILLKYIKTIYNGNIDHDNRKILLKEYHPDWKGNREIDIWLPEINFAIEFNGTYFHCVPRFYDENFFRNDMYAKDIWKRDQQKIEVMNKLGIENIVIWEHDWRTNQDNIKKELLNKINELTKHKSFGIIDT